MSNHVGKNIPGFNDISLLNQNHEFYIFRAIRESDNISVILKIPVNEFPDSEITASLRLEYEMSHRVDNSDAVSILDCIDWNQTTLIVKEDIGGSSLYEYLKNRSIKNGLIKIIPALKIAIRLSSIVSGLHSKKIIHKDINPSNFIFNTETGVLKITDFGISGIHSGEKNIVNIEQPFRGSLFYISPEQTGRVNRNLDYRSDLYSLGITLYELFTGKKPFEFDDSMEIIHAHIARLPTNPSLLNSDIPPQLSDIIMKLLQKYPNDRYKSATGLKNDLRECTKRIQENKSLEDFKPGLQDPSDYFTVSQKLYGRENHLELLMKAWENTIENSVQVLMVTGYSGVGKTALIKEIQKPLSLRKGYFIEGKYDQFKKDIPYSAIIQAFTGLMRQILAESESQLQYWKRAILNAVSDNGQIVAEVIPEISFIAGPFAEVTELSPAESQNRFNHVFTSFIRCFTKHKHPLILFLDDLQWADMASLRLIYALLSTSSSEEQLMVIGAYRSNEVDLAHPLKQILRDLAEEGLNIDNIELEPLDENSVCNLISDTLGTQGNHVSELGRLTSLKTGGNPFFINEFLKKLHTDGFIDYDYGKNLWKWDIDKIASAGITDNLTQFMLTKLESMDKKSIELLSIASCLGNHFNISDLSYASGFSPDECAQNLREPLSEGYLIADNDSFRYANLGIKISKLQSMSFRFAHDRIQQTAYHMLNHDDKSKLHHKIGNLLLVNFNEDEKKEHIFKIVNHLNNAIPLLNDPNDLENIARLNLEAAKRAHACNAYGSVLQYTTTGIKIASQLETHQHSLLFNLHLKAMESALLIGDYEALNEMENKISDYVSDTAEKVLVFEIKVLSQIAKNDLYGGVQTALDALRLVGLKFPRKPGNAHVLLSIFKTALILRNKKIEHLLSMPELESPELISAMRIMTSVFSAAYISLPALMPILVLAQVQISARSGNAQQTSFAYANYGLILAGILGNINRGYEFGQLALGILNRLNASSVESKTIFSVYSFIAHYKEPLKETIPKLEQAYQKGIETGDTEYAAWNLLGSSYTKFLCSQNLSSVASDIDISRITARKLKQESALSKVNLWAQAVSNFKNPTDTPEILNGDFYKESEMVGKLQETKQDSELAQMYVCKMMLALFYEKYAEAIKISESMKLVLASVPGTAFVMFYLAWDCLARTALLIERKNKVKKEIKVIRKNLSKLKNLAALCPENLSHLCTLIEAELLLIHKGVNNEIINLYENAIREAGRNKFSYIEAYANKRLAEFYWSVKDFQKMVIASESAKNIYNYWGSAPLAAKIEKDFSSQFRRDSEIFNGNAKQWSSGNKTLNTTELKTLDLDTVLKASKAIGGEIILNNLIDQLMKISIENAGARTGYLLLLKGNALKIVADARVNDQGIIINNLERNITEISESIVQYVARTRENLILADASSDPRFLKDNYIFSTQMKSVLCIPIINLGTLLGILYLENELTVNTFTEKRLELLKLLSGQIAVSINNALMYENLEETVKLRTKEIQLEKKKSDDLLMNILPEETANELKMTGKAKVKKFDQVTIMFTDFKDFTKISEGMAPDELVDLIDHYFKTFDEIISKYNLEKIKTIGDSYMCAGGLPVPTKNHIQDVVNAGLEIRDFVKSFAQQRKSESKPYFETRIGIHTGPVVAGVVGTKKFAYDIWGDTVNVASRMESSGDSGRVNVSTPVYEVCYSDYICEHRGQIEAKSKGLIDMYFIDRRPD